jgi:uncharacterized protein
VIFALDWGIAVLLNMLTTAFTPSILKIAGPDGPGLPAFLALCGLALLTIVLITFLGWWRVIGCNRPAEWRNLWLLLFPAVVVCLPLVAGVASPDPGTLVLSLAGYLLTGLYEESLFRGVILRILQPKGTWLAVLLSSLLFGLAHSTNIFGRMNGNLVLVGLQMLGASTFGIGMAALRLRINTLWPLMLLHAFGDLFLHLGTLPVLPMSVLHDVLLFVYGFILLLTMRRMNSARTRADLSVGPELRELS